MGISARQHEDRPEIGPSERSMSMIDQAFENVYFKNHDENTNRFRGRGSSLLEQRVPETGIRNMHRPEDILWKVGNPLHVSG